MALSAKDKAYDYMVTTGRWYAENEVLNAGVIVGMLSDYLTGDLELDYYTPNDGGSYSNLRELFRDSIKEGQETQRFDYTAEELFMWAHEVDHGLSVGTF